MGSPLPASELILREAELRERRRRVHRAEGVVAAVFVLGIAAIAAAKEAAPAAFEVATACFVIGIAASLLAVWRTARRYWRCPACDVRWEATDTLASFHWNHCPACGAALRAHATLREQERIALTEFAHEGLPKDELVSRFERRRRRGMLAAAAAAILGVATLLFARAQGFGESVEHVVVALFTGAVVAAAVLGSRCPRCRVGVIGKGRHCQRCGLLLESDPSEAVTPRTGT